MMKFLRLVVSLMTGSLKILYMHIYVYYISVSELYKSYLYKKDVYNQLKFSDTQIQ